MLKGLIGHRGDSRQRLIGSRSSWPRFLAPAVRCDGPDDPVGSGLGEGHPEGFPHDLEFSVPGVSAPVGFGTGVSAGEAVSGVCHGAAREARGECLINGGSDDQGDAR
jgi:hypothetical protein